MASRVFTQSHGIPFDSFTNIPLAGMKNAPKFSFAVGTRDSRYKTYS
jgi:hypothetical protein